MSDLIEFEVLLGDLSWLGSWRDLLSLIALQSNQFLLRNSIKLVFIDSFYFVKDFNTIYLSVCAHCQLPHGGRLQQSVHH